MPVLRWKAAEIAAITQLAEDVKSGITQLVELLFRLYQDTIETAMPRIIALLSIEEFPSSPDFVGVEFLVVSLPLFELPFQEWDLLVFIIKNDFVLVPKSTNVLD